MWLSDGPCQYKGHLVFRMVPEERIGREGGYTPHFDLLAPQHAINAAYSSQISALAALGHPVIVTDTNSNATIEEMKAFSLLKVQGGADKVKPVSLLPPDALKPHKEFSTDLVGQMEIVSGVNAVNSHTTSNSSGSAPP